MPSGSRWHGVRYRGEHLFHQPESWLGVQMFDRGLPLQGALRRVEPEAGFLLSPIEGVERLIVDVHEAPRAVGLGRAQLPFFATPL